MEVESIKQHEGKRCRIVMNNNYNYTTIIPKVKGSIITFTDKFGKIITTDCKMIGAIEVLEDNNG